MKKKHEEWVVVLMMLFVVCLLVFAGIVYIRNVEAIDYALMRNLG